MRSLKVSSRGHIHADSRTLKTGLVRASLYVHDGVISAALLESEPPRDWSDEERRIRGLALADWARALESSAPEAAIT